MSTLMVTSKCCCIRTRTGQLLGKCSRCRAQDDPDFARRCDPALNRMPTLPRRLIHHKKTPERKRR